MKSAHIQSNTAKTQQHSYQSFCGLGKYWPQCRWSYKEEIHFS